MSETAKNKLAAFNLTVEELSAIVEQAVKAAIDSAPREDKLLTVEQACQLLNVSEDWLYHNAKKMKPPCARKIGGQLRFSSNALHRYIDGAKFAVKGS
jgi:excisionase family DNA binding protein